MVSVTQRITQYNREVGQPRGGLLNPKLFTVTQHADAHGALDGKQENLHASVVGLAVDYLTRLAHTQLLDDEPAQTLGDVFRASLLGARKVSEQTEHTSALDDAVAALGKVTFSPSSVDSTRFIFNVDETAVRVACQLATYDVALRAGVGFYNPAATQLVPDHFDRGPHPHHGQSRRYVLRRVRADHQRRLSVRWRRGIPGGRTRWLYRPRGLR